MFFRFSFDFILILFQRDVELARYALIDNKIDSVKDTGYGCANPDKVIKQ